MSGGAKVEWEGVERRDVPGKEWLVQGPKPLCSGDDVESHSAAGQKDIRRTIAEKERRELSRSYLV